MVHQNYKFSSKSTEWETPQAFFDKLHREFHFTLDVCATPENAKCHKFYTKEDNGLAQSWSGHTCWMNPPYGRHVADWISKAFSESLSADTVVVCLLPAKTDTKYWHDTIMCAEEIRFVRGRLSFGKGGPAGFPSAVVVFNASPNQSIYPRFSSIDRV